MGVFSIRQEDLEAHDSQVMAPSLSVEEALTSIRRGRVVVLITELLNTSDVCYR